VDQSVWLASGDGKGVRRLIQYFLRCPFSQARMIEMSCLREDFSRPAGAGKVIYKSDHNTLGRFPEPGDEELLAGPNRNFQVFDALDFLAEVTQHIPDPGEHLIRYYGWYSNKSRGRRARGQPAAERAAQQQGPGGRDARKRWAALIKQVYEVDPLLCPKCGARMKIISFIERHQRDVIEKILQHCGLWEEDLARGPPVQEMAVS